MIVRPLHIANPAPFSRAAFLLHIPGFSVFRVGSEHPDLLPTFCENIVVSFSSLQSFFVAYAAGILFLPDTSRQKRFDDPTAISFFVSFPGPRQTNPSFSLRPPHTDLSP